MGKYIGIDLGTTFSCMAYIDENGNPVVITNSEEERFTPSTVLFDEDVTVVGKEAKAQSVLDPNNFESFVKRHMGERDYYFITSNGEKYTPEEVSAVILSKLKSDAESYLGTTVDGAVITVPAYFNEAQRKATIDAGKIAGIEVLSIINEPTAAALAFGISKANAQEQKVMVYDLGGGTFDVTVIEFDTDNITVLGTSGNRKLGGFDFDNKIVEYVINKAKEQGIDLEGNKKILQDLQLQAEKAKKVLSSKENATILLRLDNGKFKCEISREEFEDLIDGLLFTTVSNLENACDEAGITYEDIDKILLVGGSTRIPAVKEAIEEETGIIPSSEVNPDEAVAIGAAYHVLDVLRNKLDKNTDNQCNDIEIDENDIPEIDHTYEFTDVTSHGIGIVTTIENEEEINSVILPKNSQVPCEFKNRYTTVVPYQESLKIEVTQGEEEDLRYVTIIGTAEIKIQPREKIVGIEVSISCDENSIIHVRVRDLDLNKDLGEITIDRVSNLTDEEILMNKTKIGKLDISGDFGRV